MGKKDNFIHKIPTYDEIKKMNLKQLNFLTGLIRSKIIELSRNKSLHFSSNLGIVELSLALLYVFDSPSDLILYDTGHQSYVHKMITNRWNKMDSIREFNGLSGFQNPNESEHDLISTGHSGNILSICQGYIENSENKKNFLIPVIGDAALSNGLAFEALNNISFNKTPMLIVVNDNGMSISKNVGGLHKMMSKIQTSKFVFWTEKMLKKTLFKFEFGKKIYWFIFKCFEKISNFFKGKNFFEKLGFHYFGVVDGHNLKKIIKILKRLKNLVEFGPIILHVKTVKGYGLKEAEVDEKGLFHSLDLSKLSVKENSSYGEVAANFLEKLITYDNDIRIINPAMTLSSNFLELSQKFPSNYEDVGIAEEHAITKAAGIALTNKKVFVSIYSTFLQRGYDNVFHDVARLELPVVFLIDRADISYHDGDTHHGIYDLGFLKSIPNTIICSPSNKYELEKLIAMGYENKKDPFFIRYSKDICLETSNQKEFTLGSWIFIKKNKESKTCIISYGHFVNEIYLGIKNKQIDLVNALFLTNYNKEFVNKLLNSYQKIYVVEKVYDSNCLGDDLIKLAFEGKKKCSIIKINIKTNKIGFGDKKTIDKKLGIDIETIIN
ncbi:MAG: 1-deoxy-D-xylulose-5-phosphate synthase, partial [Malacoplasma sp.]|nr:1-deoxy-D-xylulose-5-phosphate synthase [Malacoplasma sp.]